MVSRGTGEEEAADGRDFDGPVSRPPARHYPRGPDDPTASSNDTVGLRVARLGGGRAAPTIRVSGVSGHGRPRRRGPHRPPVRPRLARGSRPPAAGAGGSIGNVPPRPGGDGGETAMRLIYDHPGPGSNTTPPAPHTPHTAH